MQPDVARSLALHKRWLHGKEGGEPANLRYADRPRLPATAPVTRKRRINL